MLVGEPRADTKESEQIPVGESGLGPPATGSEEMLEGWQQGCQGPLHFGKFPLVVGGVQNIREAETHCGSGPPSQPQAVAVIVT